MSNTTKHYAKRDPDAQGIHYIHHVSAMTTEGLHAKSAIAAELAHRDIEIERLRAALVAPKQPKKDFSEVDFLLSWFNENDGFSQGTKAPHKWVLQTHAELIRLRATLAAPAQAVPASVIMASVMRDDGGEHPAFCLMVAYRAEKDAKAALAMLTDEPAQAAAPAQAGEYPELPEWSKRDDLGGLVPGEVRQALRTYADATCAARVVYSRSMDLVRTFWQQHTESDALSMTMAELHDDVELVIRAARKPIEDGVLHALYADVMTGHYADGLHYWRGTPAHRFARAIEQAHGITAAQKGGQHGTE